MPYKNEEILTDPSDKLMGLYIGLTLSAMLA